MARGRCAFCRATHLVLQILGGGSEFRALVRHVVRLDLNLFKFSVVFKEETDVLLHCAGCDVDFALHRSHRIALRWIIVFIHEAVQNVLHWLRQFVRLRGNQRGTVVGAEQHFVLEVVKAHVATREG